MECSGSIKVQLTNDGQRASTSQSISKNILKVIPGIELRARATRKVTVVGVGAVGMAAAFAIMVREVANVVALVDIDEAKVRGEVLDMKQGQQFLRRCEVIGGSDYSISANSDIVIVTAGARQQEGESRLNLVQRNVDIFKRIIPEITKYSPQCIIVVVSNPVDVLTYVTSKLSCFPKNRVIGTGTLLDSARFRQMLGEKLNVSPESIHGYIIGEHGDSSVALWSRVNIAGVPLASLNSDIGTPRDKENFAAIHQAVVDSAYEIIKSKGYTSWAIGLTCYALVDVILNNQHSILPVVANAKGQFGIEDDVYLSLPCLVSANGLTHIVPPQLNASEEEQVKKSAATLLETIKGIKW